MGTIKAKRTQNQGNIQFRCSPTVYMGVELGISWKGKGSV